MRLLKHGSKIGNATVIVDIIQKGNPEIRPSTAMNPRKITTHNTGNASKGANAKAHNTYIHNLAGRHPRDTTHISWHVTVDADFIYQHIPFDEAAYHCGDGWLLNSGNRTSIGIEICENPETNTRQAEENAIALTVLLMKEFKLTANDVVPHQHWSGKYCPRVILNRDGSFVKYRNRVAATANGAPKEETVDMPNLFRPTSAALFDSVDGVLQRLEKMDKPLNVSWRKKLHNGELTDSDAIGLLFVAAERGQLTK